MFVWEARWRYSQCACIRIKRSGFEPSQWTLCRVLGQDTFLSKCFSPPMGNGKFNAGGYPNDRLASHPGWSTNTPSRFMLQISAPAWRGPWFVTYAVVVWRLDARVVWKKISKSWRSRLLQEAGEYLRFLWREVTRGYSLNRGILVHNICLISISNSVSDEATNISLLNIERSKFD